jgi:hypothetical protein
VSTLKRVRTVTLVSEQPDRRKSKAPLFAFGFDAIAEITGRKVSTVKRHAKIGHFTPSCLSSVAGYIASKKANDFISTMR